MTSNRNAQGQSKHDRAIKTIADSFARNGWSTVLADHTTAYRSPPITNGFIPDILAIHGGNKSLVEVETEDSKNLDHANDQEEAFLEWESQSSNRTFTRRVV